MQHTEAGVIPGLMYAIFAFIAAKHSNASNVRLGLHIVSQFKYVGKYLN